MKKVNICLGRFQPYTLGHYKMIEYGFKENGLSTVILMIQGFFIFKLEEVFSELL